MTLRWSFIFLGTFSCVQSVSFFNKSLALASVCSFGASLMMQELRVRTIIKNQTKPSNPIKEEQFKAYCLNNHGISLNGVFTLKDIQGDAAAVHYALKKRLFVGSNFGLSNTKKIACKELTATQEFVLGHEMEHIRKKHAQKNGLFCLSSSYISIMGIRFAAKRGMSGKFLASAVCTLASTIAIASYAYNRACELQADRNASSDPKILQAGILFLEAQTVQETEQSFIEKVFSTHPSCKERIENLEEVIKNLKSNK